MGIGNIINKIKDATASTISKTPTIKATMLGPRAVGKTSIMASIFSDSRNEIAGTSLFFNPEPSCGKELSVKKLQLMDVIEKQANFCDRPNTGAIEASNTVTSFNFEMGIKGRTKSVDIEIKDFPGEYLDSQQQTVSEFIAESHIVMIAIDTPYLMEENGKYNEQKNETSKVISFFTRNSESIKNKLILLIPLKCERYFHDGRIEEVTARIKGVYSELISFCKTNNIACAVTPIQTLGGVEFDKFIDNPNPLSNLTQLSSYRFYGDKPEYKPMFCVQPLYYLLTYVTNFYEWSKGQPQGIIDRIKNSLTSVLKDDDEFFHEIKKLSSKVKTEDKGYSIIYTNTILNIK